MKEKVLKMVWKVAKKGKQSFLVGTAHFISHSFRSSLVRYIKGARYVLIEGPLDREHMNEVVRAGFEKNAPHILDDLDGRVVDRIKQMLEPPCRKRSIPFFILHTRSFESEQSLYDSLEGMKHWMAFFTLWRKFTGKLGWKHSVDMEAYSIALEMKKEVIPLETIEEQIAVLNGIPRERVVDFISRIDQWEAYAKEYQENYLAGDLKNLRSVPGRFPTLTLPAIGERDRILYMRMKRYLEEGNAVAFVGAPHIRGINELLRLDGYSSTSILQSTRERY
jgi:hypothetical protein